MRKPATWLPLIALLALLLGLLHAGLSPYAAAGGENAVRWGAGGGLRFERGMAFSDGPLYWKASEQPRELTVEAWVVAGEGARAPRTVLALADGERVVPLEITAQQERTALHYRVQGWLGALGSRAVSLETGLPELQLVHLAVTSGAQGTRLYVDGSAPDVVRLRQPLLPAGPAFSARLVLGSSAAGGAAWAGEFRGLAVFDRALEERDVREHDRRFRAGAGARALAGEPQLRALFAFDEGSGAQVNNLAAPESPLQIPRRPHALRWSVLELPDAEGPWTRSALADALRNLLGFAPFGLLLAHVLGAQLGQAPLRAFAAACAASAGLSLAIELCQALVPERHSSALDLALNSAGGAAGAALAASLQWLRSPRR